MRTKIVTFVEVAIIMRHYGPSEQVSNGEEGYNATKLIRRIDK